MEKSIEECKEIGQFLISKGFIEKLFWLYEKESSSYSIRVYNSHCVIYIKCIVDNGSSVKEDGKYFTTITYDNKSISQIQQELTQYC